MPVAVRDNLTDLASFDDGEHGEDEDDEEKGQGNLIDDDQPGRVMGTITNTVQHYLERFR
jgi:hypothetical protein